MKTNNIWESNDNPLSNEYYKYIESSYAPSSSYDYLVLFTGGKDSTYLAHAMKQAPGGRVCLFTVNNGFEDESFLKNAIEIADQLKCEHIIYSPPGEYFEKFYKFLIMEPALRTMDSNPMCFFCGRLFMTMGLRFAERQGIPCVVYGATPEQINRGQGITSMRSFQMFEMVSKRIFARNYEVFKMTKSYLKSERVRSLVDEVFYESKTVKLLFPFQFLDYDINGIKRTLEDVYGWQNPIGISNQHYMSSGCNLTKLFGFLKNKMGFSPKEQEQFTKDYEKGIVDEIAYKHGMRMLDQFLSEEITPELMDLAKRLDLEGALK
jgi:hypothetical protein